jgi:hypothetical protein
MRASDQDQPALSDILRVVREYIEGIIERVPDEDRYHAMCCVYLMSVAERELIAQEPDTELNARLHSLLGDASPKPIAIHELATRIRAGRCDAAWDETFALVLDQVINKVRVSKPDHLHPMHRE